MLKKELIILLLSIITLQAQKFNFETHFATFEGELTADDIYEVDFGRLDAYELKLREGDYIKLKLTADFFPFLAIVAPSNEYKLSFPKDNKSIVYFEEDIDETGLWHIYIAGDSTDTGNHTLKICHVAADSRKLPVNADYTILTAFLLSHTNTDYFYFRNKECNIKNGEWKFVLPEQNLFESGKIIISENRTKLILEIPIDEELFQKISTQLSLLLNKEWNVRKSEKEIKYYEIEGLKKIILSKNDKKIQLIIINEK
jgi:hypothetical protein